MKMFGVGKRRFSTLNRAARNGQEHCPYDGRYIARGKPTMTLQREKVHGFLSRLYVEAAEHIPDGLNSNKRPRHGIKKLDDVSMDRTKIKHLPYGSINDYFRQCVAACPDVAISRKLFCDVPFNTFY